jgi:hypothetical protein
MDAESSAGEFKSPEIKLNMEQPPRLDGQNAVEGQSRQISTNERDLDIALHSTLIPVLANFLVRLGLFAAEGKDVAMNRLSGRCLAIFRKMSHLVPMKNVRMTYFDRYFQSTVETLKQKSIVDGGKELSKILSQPSSGQTKSSSGPSNVASSGKESGSVSQQVSERSLEVFLNLVSCGLECSDGPGPLFLNNISALRDLVPIVLGSLQFAKAQNSFREVIVMVNSLF